MSDTASSPRPSMTKILGIAALMDLLTGVVLAVIGVTSDLQAFSIVGVVMLLCGGGLLAYVMWMRNKPEAL